MLNLLSFAGILKSIGGVLLAVAILLVMVTIHEFGHYIAGKLLGFKINEFAVGFGPALYKKRSKKTGELFALRAIPLGGYCAFDGEDEIDKEPFDELEAEKDGGSVESNEEYPEPKGERFNDQPPWKRIIVLIAGASMNYILALFLIVLMFACFGRPVYKVAELMPEDGIVQTLQVNDTILEIDGKRMYMITDYMDILDGKEKGENVSITVLREGEEQEVVLTLQRNADFVNMSDTGTLLYAMGVNSMYAVMDKDGFFQTIGNSFAYSVKIGGTVLRSLGELLTGKLGMDAMGGPITTIKVTSEVAASGLTSFLNIAAFIGVNLAVFNLLPVPALDGSKVVFCLIEWIRKKPVNRKVETMIHFIGIIFLFGFAILVDLLQLF